MNIHRACIIPAENNLSHLCQALNKFISEMDVAESQLGTLKHEINFRLLNRVAHIITKQHFVLPKFIKVVRIPGTHVIFLFRIISGILTFLWL
jgi:hypothetical protein